MQRAVAEADLDPRAGQEDVPSTRLRLRLWVGSRPRGPGRADPAGGWQLPARSGHRPKKDAPARSRGSIDVLEYCDLGTAISMLD
jgi:hypothetical protein